MRGAEEINWSTIVDLRRGGEAHTLVARLDGEGEQKTEKLHILRAHKDHIKNIALVIKERLEQNSEINRVVVGRGAFPDGPGYCGPELHAYKNGGVEVKNPTSPTDYMVVLANELKKILPCDWA